jgi:hypothetical protein
MSAAAERAIDDVLRHGRAILKFISANDVGLTGSHQAGFYLPRAVWQLFTPHAPVKGRNDKSPVAIRWPDQTTHSMVTWYGTGTRSEYRLTNFGRHFPWLSHDLVGALLVLVPVSHQEFHTYVLNDDADIEQVQASLDVYVLGRWGVYLADGRVEEAADACTDRIFREFAESIDVFPESRTMSAKARETVLACVRAIAQKSCDDQLLAFVGAELALFRMVERRMHEAEVQRAFTNIDDFVNTAHRILNARKARAGRALENHVEFLLTEAGVPFEMRAVVDGTRPDVLLPGQRAYEDAQRGAYPVEKLIMVGVKTTCKDRWRQVLNEAPLIATKHILTMQEGISPKQLEEMHRSNVVLVVPKELHAQYPKEHAIALLDVETFVASAARTLHG